MADWSEQAKQRLANKEALAEAGHDVSPFRFEQTHTAAGIHKDHMDAVPEQLWPQERVRLAGRLLSLRRMGKVTFAHLQQEGVRIQLYFQRELTPDYPLLKKLDTGDLIGVMGSVFTTKTGEVTIRVDGWRLLTKSLLPLPDKFHGIRDKEVRYRQRYLDTIQNPEVTEVFRTRARVVRGIRRFLEARGFLEVETPVIVPIAGGTEARPFTTHHNALSTNFNLRIALELPLKRLLVGGIERVYEIGRVFRNEGIDLSHNPEFTMLELYWAYADYNDVADLVEEMISGLAQDLRGNYTVPFRGTELNFTPPFLRIDFVDSLIRATGIDFDPLDLSQLRNWTDTRHPEMKSVPDYKLLDKLFGEYVEPKLQNPTFVFDFPLAISPLARRHRSRPGLTERWDLFIGGTEIAPAYSELNDALDQRLRFEEQVRRRAAGDDEAPEIDEDFLTALAYGMPPAGGLGVGIDRLTMVLADQSSLRDVILFPLLKPRQTDEIALDEAEILE